ncbi:MAG: hypothetical protein GY696_31460, partial [Gammaproteobacteria bacterium]|nr:hypothetical protein [Gammaproteobacteria bacterium]
MKKPEVFSGASTPEGFDRFIRLFQLHLRSHGCEDPEEWVDILEGFLGDTPALVYTQLRRDQPSISFEEVVRELHICFGRPLDARMARHKIHDLTWTPGESLTQLATRIRDLHFQAHSKTPFEEREAYAGDTFYRLLPQEWRLRIRDKNLSSLSEYLSAAIECEYCDREMRQSGLRSHPIRPLAESFSSSGFTPVMNTTDQPQVERREQTDKPPKPPKQPPTCYQCGVKGHIAPNCPLPKQPPSNAPTAAPAPPTPAPPTAAGTGSPLSPVVPPGNQAPPDSRVVQALSGPR